MPRALALSCLGFAVPPVAAQSRNLLPLTNTAEAHTAAVLSPDGGFIAFRGPEKIGVVSYLGGAEFVAAAGRNLGTFVWAPDSLGIYYMDGVDVRYVARTGGSSRLVTTLAESGQALWAVKRDGSDLLGTWLFVRNSGGQAVRETQVFALATDGLSGPRVLVQSLVVIDGLRISPDDNKIVYREYDATPFSRRDYVVANIDGSSPVSLTAGQGLGLNPDLPWWLGDSTGICFARIDRVLSRAVVERLTLTDPTPYPLTYTTAARNPSTSADGQYVAFEGWWPFSASWTPMVMPAGGGGQIVLDTSRVLVFSGTPMLGGAAGERMILSGALGASPQAQVLKAELVREMSITPRADVGGTVTVAVPAAVGEAAIVWLAAAPLAVAQSVPGLAGGFQLDPTTLVTVFSGVGTGGSLTVPLSVPNLPYLRHKAVYLQAVRLPAGAPTGDFTRLVELPIF